MEVLTCTVKGIKSYGVFVTCGEYDGLVHISEISEQFVNDVSAIFQVGDEVNLALLEKDDRYLKMKLSYIKNHPMHERIRRHVTVKIGFNALNRKLYKWIEQGSEENES